MKYNHSKRADVLKLRRISTFNVALHYFARIMRVWRNNGDADIFEYFERDRRNTSRINISFNNRTMVKCRYFDEPLEHGHGESSEQSASIVFGEQ